MSLADWGWDERWEALAHEALAEGLSPARVTVQEKSLWTVESATGTQTARVVAEVDSVHRPVVGDWVMVRPSPHPSDPVSIEGVLTRRARFSRGAAGERTAEQVVAANVDRVWLVHGLDLPVNERRIERYLALAWDSGAQPEIVLAKRDLTEDLPGALATVGAIAFGVAVWSVSVKEDEGVLDLEESLRPGQTVALLGPSGVGKSSLINRLAGGDILDTGDVRDGDRKGRHTTTRRQLVRLSTGALLLDTPGMRELRVWDLEEGLPQAFPEIEYAAQRCRFRDCAHESEPGCAVLEALAAGALSEERMASYRKLQAEAAHQRRRSDPVERAKALSDWKTSLKTLKYHPKHDRRR